MILYASKNREYSNPSFEEDYAVSGHLFIMSMAVVAQRH